MKRMFLILTVGFILFSMPSCNSRNNELGRNNYTDNYVYSFARLNVPRKDRVYATVSRYVSVVYSA